jgi:2-hydroxy-3-oxopropionate reductase
MKVGFVGLGVMGRPMCKNLMKSGCKLRVFDVRRESMDYFSDDEVYKAASAGEVAEGCDVVFVMVRNSDDVRAALFSDTGILQHSKPGMVIVDLSSIAPFDSIEFARVAHERHVIYLDVPVSGGELKAIDGTLAFMAGGDVDSLKLVHGLLQTMGRSVVRVGNSGSGSMAKLINQVIVNLNIAVVGEAMVLGAKAGLDLNRVYEAISPGLAGSAVLDTKLAKMTSGDFEPGGSLSINYKDITNVMNAANELNVPMPLTSHLHEIMKTFGVQERSSLDHAALVKFFEKNAGVTVRTTPDNSTTAEKGNK